MPGSGAVEQFFSMLSPNDYNGKPPNTYIDSYRLEMDMSWTQVDRIEVRDNKRKFDPVLLGLTDSHVEMNASRPPQLQLTLI